MFTWGKGCKHTVFFALRAKDTQGKGGKELHVAHPEHFAQIVHRAHRASPPEHFAQFVHSDMQRTVPGRLVSRRVTRGQIAQSVHSVQGGRAISWP